MSGRFHRSSVTATRRVPLAVLAAVHFLVASGIPLPSVAAPRKPTDRPFPCMDRPCGCQTYDRCWAGDCCCFTMAEKLAWAKANSITPPVSARVASARSAEPAGHQRART